MKSKLIPLGLICACVSLARADFTPIPLDPTSFNQDPVIEKTAPPSINDYVTITPGSRDEQKRQHLVRERVQHD